MRIEAEIVHNKKYLLCERLKEFIGLLFKNPLKKCDTCWNRHCVGNFSPCYSCKNNSNYEAEEGKMSF